MKENKSFAPKDMTPKQLKRALDYIESMKLINMEVNDPTEGGKEDESRS